MINTFSFGSYILVYNGQIYNTKELSETLKENGFTLNSHSDTEVLLKSYIHYGKKCSKSFKWNICICYMGY